MNLYIIEWWNTEEERSSFWQTAAVANEHEAVAAFYEHHQHILGTAISVYEYKGAYLNAEPR